MCSENIKLKFPPAHPDGFNASQELIQKAAYLLWGKVKIECLNDVPSSAKPVFREICCVEGILDIHFKSYGKGPYDGRCLVELAPDKNPVKIKGSVYDKGKERERQDFEITVQD